MKSLNKAFKHSYLLVVMLFLFPILLSAQNVFFLPSNSHDIGDKAIIKINQMGEELYNKTKVAVYAVSGKSIDNKSASIFVEETTKNLIKPYIVLILITEDNILDIVNSNSLNDKFKKKEILSPFSFSGSIIPLLAEKKNNDKYSAALLNGYADIVEQVAKSYNITLDSAIGSANKITLNVVRLIFYGTLIFAISFYIYRKVKFIYGKK